MLSEIGTCRCCGEQRAIFKYGFCANCYKYKIQKKYILNPKIKNVSKNAQYALINEINEKQVDINVKELAKKYGLSMARVYKILQAYFDTVFVKRDENEPAYIHETSGETSKLDLAYNKEKDVLEVSCNKGKYEIAGNQIREILKTML